MLATQCAAVSTTSGATTTAEQRPPRDVSTITVVRDRAPASTVPPTTARAGAEATRNASATSARRPCHSTFLGDIAMNPISLAGPAVEPITLASMKAYLRLDEETQDELVSALIVAGRLTVERATRLALIEQSLRYTTRAWPVGRVVCVPLAPVIAVDAVRILRSGSQAETVAPDLYRLDSSGDPVRILLDPTLPGAGAPASGLEIDVTCGFGASPAAVPEPLVLAVQRLVAQWFERRGDDPPQPATGLPADVRALIAPFTRPRLA